MRTAGTRVSAVPLSLSELTRSRRNCGIDNAKRWAAMAATMPSAMRGRADLAYGKMRNNVAKVPFSLIVKPNPPC